MSLRRAGRFGMWRTRIALLAVLGAIALGASQGCISVTIGAARKGNPIDPEKVAALRQGTHDLDDVLAALGAPLEVHAHTDGTLLVYR
ncbi:MAG: hypothetical protein ACYS47_14865, partial [Planctomycetota bacterium]